MYKRRETERERQRETERERQRETERERDREREIIERKCETGTLIIILVGTFKWESRVACIIQTEAT